METFLQDLRYGARMLRHNPGFSVVAIVTLALGIGANTAIFSVVNGVLLQPLPYREPDRLVRVYTEFPGMDLRKFWMSPPEFLDIEKEANSWENIGAWQSIGVNVGTEADPIRVTASSVTRGLIETLGIQPAIGRNFTPEEDRSGGPRTALISDSLWRRAFAANPEIVGSEIQINAQPFTVVGILPSGYSFPPGTNDPAEVWLPFQFDPAALARFRGNHRLYVVGRLKSDVSLAQARSEMDSLMEGWKAENRAMHLLNNDSHPVLMFPLHEDIIATARPAVLMLLGAVGFVLLIACVNVANLLLARAEARRREFAMRLALGAGRGRLLRQFLTEGLILVLLGAIAGVGLAKLGLSSIMALAPDSVPRTADIRIDLPVLLFTLGLCLFSVIVFALAPLWQMRDRNLATWLHGSGQRTSGGGGRHTLRKVLVITEIALAVVPIIGSGLMIRAFWKLRQVDLGFNPDNVVSFSIALPGSRYQGPDRLRFANQLNDRLASLPGVTSASITSGLPPLRPINANDTDIEDYQGTPEGPAENVDYWNFVGEDYFKTMGIRTLDGRTFQPSDRSDSALRVCVINQAMASRFWDRNPIGRRVNPAFNDPPTWLTVVGIVEDTKNIGVDKPAGTELYFLQPQTPPNFVGTLLTFVVKTGGKTDAVTSGIRTVMNDMDASVPIYNLRTMGELVERSLVRPRFLSLLLGTFSVIALALASVGIFGVMAYTVAQRTQEIGVRVALGASTSKVLALVMGQGLQMTLIGMAVGLIGSFFLSRVMIGLLFEVSATDPITFVLVGVGLTAVGLLACFVPASRAARVDPMVALRYE